MRPCPYYLEGKCRYDDLHCRFVQLFVVSVLTINNVCINAAIQMVFVLVSVRSSVRWLSTWKRKVVKNVKDLITFSLLKF